MASSSFSSSPITLESLCNRSEMIPENQWPVLEPILEDAVHYVKKLKREVKQTEKLISEALKIHKVVDFIIAFRSRELIGCTVQKSRYRLITTSTTDDNLNLVVGEFGLVLRLMETIDPHCTPEMRKKLVMLKEKLEIGYKQIASNLETESLVGEVCCICLEDLENCWDIATVGVCCQKYHRECISRWLQKSETCPVCRRKTMEISRCFTLVDWTS